MHQKRWIINPSTAKQQFQTHLSQISLTKGKLRHLCISFVALFSIKMKIKALLASLFGIAILASTIYFFNSKEETREEYEAFLKSHPYYSGPEMSLEEIEKLPKTDRPDLAWQQDYLLTMNPKEKRPTPEVLYSYFEKTNINRKNQTVPGDQRSPWIELGPTNVGGRVRAILFDSNDKSAKKVWAGGVTGGLWYNNDITHQDSGWHAVDNFWDNIAVSCIAADPTDPKTIYVGTGEGWRQSVSGAPGAGIWKTTDAGKTWTHIEGTEDMYYINDMIVRDESGSGALYVGSDYSYPRNTTRPGIRFAGLYKSTDGGDNFTRMTYGNNNSFRVADLEIGADNRLWVGTYYNDGRILYSDDGSNFTESVVYSGEGRVELACAPSNANYVYAVFEKSSVVDKITVTKDGGKTWTSVSEPNDADGGIPAEDFSRRQAWYDLIIAVDPTDEETALIGAVDLFKTTDAGTNWTQIAHWYGGFGFPYVHADQHAIVYRPTANNNSQVLFGNDGGLFYSTDIDNSNPTFEHKVKNFNTTQFYAAAIHPDTAKAYFLAGSQDNGTQRFQEYKATETDRPTGGDGAFCHIDQDDPSIQITAYVYNRYYISRNEGGNFSQLHWDNSTNGWFINPTDYDDNQDALYCSYSEDGILRLSNLTFSKSDDVLAHDLGSKATALKVSPFSTSSSTVFIGTVAGRIFKMENAEGASYSTSELTPLNFPKGAISSIEFGRNEDEILVTFFNYGVPSIWFSPDGGDTWTAKEGDLMDMPVRWVLMNPTDENNVIIATEVGIWSTYNFGDTYPNWSSSSNGMANVRVDMLKMRQSDYTILAATHGRGLFASQGFTYSPPQVSNQPSSINICVGKNTSMQVKAVGAEPIIYQWFHNNTMIDGAEKKKLSFSNITVSDSGAYYCVVSNKDGTDTSDIGRLALYAIPTPDLGPDLTIRPEVVLQLNPGEGYKTYVWSQGAPNPTLTLKGEDLGIGTHEIRVTVYNEDNCFATDTISITVDESASINTSSNTDASVYPNPTTDFITINTKAQITIWEIFDMNGKAVITSKSAQIDVSSLKSGQYILKGIGKTGVIESSFIKK